MLSFNFNCCNSVYQMSAPTTPRMGYWSACNLSWSRYNSWRITNSCNGRSVVSRKWQVASSDVRDCRLPPRCRWDLRSSGTLRNSLPMFRDNLSIPSQRVKMSDPNFLLTFRDNLSVPPSRVIGNEASTYFIQKCAVQLSFVLVSLIYKRVIFFSKSTVFSLPYFIS
jgi:hypothetical protein